VSAPGSPAIVWPRRALAAIAALGCAAALLAGAAERAGAARLVKAYCHPTGDYCVGVFKKAGRIKLDLTTPSLIGSYEICARRLANGVRDCRDFQLKPVAGGAVNQSRIDFQNRFGNPPSGRYCANWKYTGDRLHKLCFGYRRQAT
jgi:hypothetical protein